MAGGAAAEGVAGSVGFKRDVGGAVGGIKRDVGSEFVAGVGWTGVGTATGCGAGVTVSVVTGMGAATFDGANKLGPEPSAAATGESCSAHCARLETPTTSDTAIRA
jgi:hypothetical protein